VTPTAANPASTAAWSWLVVAGVSFAPLPPGGSRWWTTSVLRVVADDSSMGQWSMAVSSSADEVDRRAAA
jgi:hypothetical protein